MITTAHSQESLSRSFIYAIAGLAGLNHTIQSAFDYGIDGQFRPVANFRGHRVESGFGLDFQLKSTVNWSHSKGYVVYDLDAQTHNDLGQRHPSATGAILILLCLPKDQTKWSSFTERRMLLQRCCYWYHVNGKPTSNTATQRIFIPRTNLFDVNSLTAIMASERIRRIGP